MPFNGSGSFSIVNTFVPNTTILSAAVNANFTDIATGLSDCLTRDGQAGMTAALKAISGALATPSITFTSDLSSGLYLPATGQLGMVSKSLGMAVNSSIYVVSSAAVSAGGSGYAVGDTIALTGGTAINQAILTVATLSGSAVATVTVAYQGYYTVVPTNPAAQGSSNNAGTGATFTLTTSTQYTRSLVTDESGNAVWQRLGASTFVSGIMARANAYDFLATHLTAGSGIAISRAATPVISTTLSPALVPNYLSGLTMSTAGGSGTMSIAAGVANDSTNTTLMSLAALNKTTASWAVGTGNGGIDTGAIANTTWYHFYEIERVDTGVTDVIFSLSASAPSLPANYTLYRRIGSGRTDGSAHWTAFTQTGDTFIWGTAVADATATGTNSNSARTLVTLTVPTGVVVAALFRGELTGVSSSVTVTFMSPQETDQTTANDWFIDLGAANGGFTAGAFERLTNTSAQLAWRTRSSGGTFNIGTYGWKDQRGR